MTEAFVMPSGSGLLRCCRMEIESWNEKDPPRAGTVDFCQYCGADLIFDGVRWSFDTRTFDRIREDYKADLDAKRAGEAYSRLFREPESK